jgi:hypothetical protein
VESNWEGVGAALAVLQGEMAHLLRAMADRVSGQRPA